jgi:hypothetical protein
VKAGTWATVVSPGTSRERRKAEDRLRDSEAKYPFVAEKMSDIVGPWIKPAHIA